MRVLLNDIFQGDRQRRDYGVKEMEELQASLKENGQLQPILIRPSADYDKKEEDYEGQPWTLVAGGRRLAAALLLGWQDIEAYQREEMKELTAKALELYENLHRKALTYQEQLDARSELVRIRKIENPTITEGEIAKELGVSQANLSRDLKTKELMEKFPGLKKSTSKHAALQAGIILEQNAAREKRASMNLSALTATSLGPLEKRVRTADALEYTRALEGSSMDLVLIDGPYGYNYWKRGQKLDEGESALSSYDDDPKRAAALYVKLVPELVRVLRSTGWLVAFAGKETYDLIFDLLENTCAEHASARHSIHTSQCEAVAGKPNPGLPCRWLRPNPYPWFWHRPNSRNQPRHPMLHAKNVVELILICNMGRAKLTKPGTNLLTYDADYGKDRIHANQKPIALYRDLVERFTFTGDNVLDTFFGSGNSLAAVASLARVPYGCDSNPEMLPFALGSIKKLSQPVTETTVKQALERYQKALARELVDEELPDEAEHTPEPENPIAPSQRKAGQLWEFEVLKIPEGFLGYFYYAGHNMGQRRGDDRDTLEMELSDGCLKLNQLSTLGIIDPTSCTPEEAMAALSEYEASLKEEPA